MESIAASLSQCIYHSIIRILLTGSANISPSTHFDVCTVFASQEFQMCCKIWYTVDFYRSLALSACTFLSLAHLISPSLTFSAIASHLSNFIENAVLLLLPLWLVSFIWIRRFVLAGNGSLTAHSQKWLWAYAKAIHFCLWQTGNTFLPNTIFRCRECCQPANSFRSVARSLHVPFPLDNDKRDKATFQIHTCTHTRTQTFAHTHTAPTIELCCFSK